MGTLAIVIFWIICTSTQLLVGGLLFPNSTVFQLTSSLSIPVTGLPPSRRLLFDWGFQMNYYLPNNLTFFYNAPIWPGLVVSKRDLALSELKQQHSQPKAFWRIQEISEEFNDFTAGELYRAAERILKRYGFHETCLLLSVCELAAHPFEDPQDSVLSNILHFLLTPSLHEGFARSDPQNYRESFEQAELRGQMGRDCAKLYPDCLQDFLNLITKVL